MASWEKINVKWGKLNNKMQCNICGAGLGISNQCLVCENKHTFNLSRYGYADFASNAKQSGYKSGLWEARRRVFTEGFFDPVINVIKKMLPVNDQTLTLDAGCGEGSFIGALGISNAIGVDLSRDGIRIAAGKYQDNIWCVADLARLPLKTGSVELIINCLSPANYNEFERVLSPDGMIIKVVPTKNHLYELRRLWDKDDPHDGESAEDIFFNRYPNGVCSSVEHMFRACGYAGDIAAMTPLSWRSGRLETPQSMDITLSVRVLSVIYSKR